jgi:hypothetical protein
LRAAAEGRGVFQLEQVEAAAVTSDVIGNHPLLIIGNMKTTMGILLHGLRVKPYKLKCKHKTAACVVKGCVKLIEE